MKKATTIIIAALFVLGVGVPSLAFAIGPKDCCKLKHDIKIQEGKAKGIATCLVGGDSLTDPIYDTQCTKDKPCTFKKDCTIGERPTDTCDGVTVDAAANVWGIVCVVNTIYNVTDWIFYLMLMATVLLVVIGGAMYMMSAGDSEKAGKGKSLIIYGIIGLGIAVFAKAVPSIVKLVLGI